MKGTFNSFIFNIADAIQSYSYQISVYFAFIAWLWNQIAKETLDIQILNGLGSLVYLFDFFFRKYDVNIVSLYENIVKIIF